MIVNLAHLTAHLTMQAHLTVTSSSQIDSHVSSARHRFAQIAVYKHRPAVLVVPHCRVGKPLALHRSVLVRKTRLKINFVIT